MHPTVEKLSSRARTMLLGTTVLAGMAMAFVAVAPAFAQEAGVETVVVTGYRASLTDSTNAKRASVSFSDSVFAEDIGKFPDTNIAESFNRIPGITIAREIDNEGLTIQIRGLGTSFTKILLNNSQIAVASTGGTDNQSTNREVDLNMFPTELFTQLVVNKTPSADTVEGGAAGTVNMRSARPFDNPGQHLTYVVQEGNNSNNSGAFSPHGALIASGTSGPFGILVGLSGQYNRVYDTGWESTSWTHPNMTAAQCGATSGCNSIGSGNWTIPAVVPVGVTAAGLTPGHVIDSTYLLALNPGNTIAQLNNALMPRLGRYMYEQGHRARYNSVVSLEFRPTDNLHFYVDMIGGRINNDFDRSDMDWQGRNGGSIPVNEKVDANGVVTSATFANAQWFLEARPYKEKEDFVSINPGMEWQVTDKLHVDLQANASRSHFFRNSPTFLLITAPNAPNGSANSSPVNAIGVPSSPVPAGGTVFTWALPGAGGVPSMTTNLDWNNPANFEWAGGRVNNQDEKRYTYTNGLHLDATYGGDEMNLKVGGAYDDVSRTISGYDNSAAWQNAICGDNPNVFVPSPNTQPGCYGLNVVGNAAAVNAVVAGASPTYPGLGTGYSVGSPALAYQGSLVPQSALASYLRPGPAGFVAINYKAIEAASHYASFDYPNAPYSTGLNTGGSSGAVDEKTVGLYGELNGVLHPGSRNLKYNVGLRWIQTLQFITGPVSVADPRNASLALGDGGKYPNVITQVTTRHMYQAFLPSFNIVYEVADDFQVRAALSRTMTRPNPSSMLPGVTFNDPGATNATVGNAALAPFYSNNIDVGAELYTGGEGYVGVAMFRKSLSGFTTSTVTDVPFSFMAQYGYTYDTISPTQQAAINARGGPAVAHLVLAHNTNAGGLLTINGLELNWVQPLDFLLADYGLKGLGFTANATIIDQKGSGAAPAIATGVAPYTYNLTGYYENNGAMLRMSYVFNAQSYNTGSNQNAVCLPSTADTTCSKGAYQFQAARGELDFSSSYRLSNLFGEIPSDPELTFDIQNLTRSKLRSFFQYTEATQSIYKPGSLFLLGLRGSW